MSRETIRPGVTISRPECTPAQRARWRMEITRAVLKAWKHDVDIGDLVSAALTDAARQLRRKGHGRDALTLHRSGSWEAEHIRALAYLLDDEAEP